MQIKPHKSPQARQLQVIALATLIKAAIIDSEDGEVLLINNGNHYPTWGAIRVIAPECFCGPRSEQWAWRILDSVGVRVSGGTARDGKTIATLMAEPQDEPR